MKKIDEMNEIPEVIDEMNKNTEVNENTEEKNEIHLTMSDLIDMGMIFGKILVLVLVLIACWIGIESVFKNLAEQQRYNAKKSVSAGIITDKEIINGHTENDAGIVFYDGKVGYNLNNNKNYVPTAYRIYISAEFEYNGEIHQGSNYFDVSEDVYNSYNVGDYFDSKDLTGSSEQSSN